MVSQDELLKTYRRMADDVFTHFATREASTLTPEALAILRDELRRRGTVPDADLAIDVQLRRLSSEEFEKMVLAFRRQPCPECGGSEGLLDAAIVARGKNRDVFVGCVPCVRRELKSAMSGWAGEVSAAVGGLSSAAAILHNDAEALKLDAPCGSEALRNHIWYTRGEWAHFLR